MARTLALLIAGLGLALTGPAGPAAAHTAGTTAPAGPATADATLTVTARYALLGDTPDAVVLVGRYSCGPYPGGVPERGVLDLGVRQSADGAETSGFGYLEPQVCDGTSQWFAAEVSSYSGSFVAGPATWSASGYVEGAGGMQHVHVPATPIRIRAAALR